MFRLPMEAFISNDLHTQLSYSHPVERCTHARLPYLCIELKVCAFFRYIVQFTLPQKGRR